MALFLCKKTGKDLAVREKCCNFAARIKKVSIIRVLGKPRKKQENGQENNSSECAVYAFQHPLLRLSDCGKRARNKANCLRASISDRWTHCIPSELHYQ